MIVTEKKGKLNTFVSGSRTVDYISLEWYETNKRILHKRTNAGKEIIIKFLKESPDFVQDDVIYEDDYSVIAIEIQPCEAIIVRPSDMFEMASVCYEIGNKHLPLFFSNNEIAIPFDAPLFALLASAGYAPAKESRKLMQQLKTTVMAHGQRDNKQTLFSKILKLTTTSPDV